ncbi:hypothetical protein ABCS02_16780 [Microbacterium sp. X-17]|uniref:hypothetical protein n=1 Tax=Microbacterium sp. X-17 TaxID=3144404 RepID=UPI0031F5C9AB
MILFDKDSYEVKVGETITITGRLLPGKGESVPADFRFNVTFPGAKGYSWTGPTVAGATFTMTLTAYEQATDGAKLRVSSSNYPVYAPGEATITVIGAPVPTASGSLLFDNPLYVVESGKELGLSGTLVPADGTEIPSDIRLEAVVEDVGYTLSEPVSVSGNTFSLKVADQGGAAGAVTVHSPNYPGYSAAKTQLTVLPPGYVEAGYGMLPIANTWVAATKATGGRDSAVRWFRPAAAGPLVVSAATLGKAWLDLRVSLQNQATFTDNFLTDPFQQPVYTGAFPGGFPALALRTEAQVVSLTVGGVAHDVSRGIGMRLGGATVTGPGALTGLAEPVVAFWPNRDSTGAATANGNVYAFLPSSLPKGAVGRVEIVTSVTRQDGALTRIGFVFDYRYN